GQYVMDHRDPPVRLSDLQLDQKQFPRDSCSAERYFKYSIDIPLAIATRCTSNGKEPQGRKAYRVTLDLANSTWGGTGL
ncbi:MAG: hypothetical protein WC547_03520, partial [Candidatus Omnitrophota bacterium]